MITHKVTMREQVDAINRRRKTELAENCQEYDALHLENEELRDELDTLKTDLSALEDFKDSTLELLKSFLEDAKVKSDGWLNDDNFSKEALEDELVSEIMRIKKYLERL